MAGRAARGGARGGGLGGAPRAAAGGRMGSPRARRAGEAVPGRAPGIPLRGPPEIEPTAVMPPRAQAPRGGAWRSRTAEVTAICAPGGAYAQFVPQHAHGVFRCTEIGRAHV